MPLLGATGVSDTRDHPFPTLCRRRWPQSSGLVRKRCEWQLPIPGGVAGSGAVRPVYLGGTNKGVTSFDLFVFARSARPLERSGAALPESRRPAFAM